MTMQPIPDDMVKTSKICVIVTKSEQALMVYSHTFCSFAWRVLLQSKPRNATAKTTTASKENLQADEVQIADALLHNRALFWRGLLLSHMYKCRCKYKLQQTQNLKACVNRPCECKNNKPLWIS